MNPIVFRSFLLFTLLSILLTGCAGNFISADPDGNSPAASEPPNEDGSDESTEQTEPMISPTEEPNMKHYKRVILLGVDGAGTFFREADTPYLDTIFADGATSYHVKTSYPTISAQCWGSMLHGVLPEFHRLSNEIVSSRRYDVNSPYPSIFRILREADENAKLASFCNWNPINYGIVEEGLGVVKDTGNDPAVCDRICNYLEENDPTLLFAQFDSVDGAGHHYGYGTEGHLAAITAVDELIGRIYDKLKEKDLLDDTLFLVTADHGGTPGGSHGGDTPAERYVYLGIVGKTVEHGEIEDAEVRDIPAIIAYALGLTVPDTWTGRLPAGVFAGVGGGEHIEAEIPVSENRKHENETTPALSETEALLRNHNVLAYLPFDGDATDLLGGTEPENHGKLYYSEGYFGEAISLDDGYITLPNVSVGNQSFTASFWLKTNGVSGGSDPVLLSDKDWTNGINTGFVLSLRSADIKFNAGDGKETRKDSAAMLPADYTEGWMHVILSVDREKNTVSLYYDFQLESISSIPATLQDISFDSLPLRIGQDGTGCYPCSLPAQIDEFILTADAFTEEDVKALKEYYQKSNKLTVI